jgi:adenylate kinase family enzyme
MLVLHIAGNSGSGKSTLCARIQKELGIECIDTDIVQDEIIRKHPKLLKDDNFHEINKLCLQETQKWIKKLKKRGDRYAVICGISFWEEADPGLYSDYMFFLDVPIEELYRRKSIRVIKEISGKKRELLHLFENPRQDVAAINNEIFYKLEIKGACLESFDEFKQREEQFRWNYVERKEYNLIDANVLFDYLKFGKLEETDEKIKEGYVSPTQKLLFHITGPSGCGKTTLGKKIEELSGNTIPVFDSDDFLFRADGDREKAIDLLESALEESFAGNKIVVLVGMTVKPSLQFEIDHGIVKLGRVIRCDALTMWKQFNKRMLDDIVDKKESIRKFIDEQTVDSTREDIDKTMEFTFGMRGERFPLPFFSKAEMENTDFNFLLGTAPYSYKIMNRDEIVDEVIETSKKNIEGVKEEKEIEKDEEDDIFTETESFLS